MSVLSVLLATTASTVISQNTLTLTNIDEDVHFIGTDNFGFVRDHQCEYYGMERIRDPEICQQAAEEMTEVLGLKTNYNFLDHVDHYYDTTRPDGCIYHKFGNVGQYYYEHDADDCDIGTGVQGCFCQYTPKSDTVYILFNEVVTWETAADRCSNLKNGQLATFDTMNEYELIVDAVRDIQRRNPLHGAAWIGMTDFAEEGVWTFIDGDNSFCDEFGGCINAPFWMEGEPNNLGDEHCAVVTTETGRDMYDQKNVNDARCEAEVEGYICEITNPSQIYYA